MDKILLVEDDKTLGETLFERLKKEGYNVLWAETFHQANESINNNLFDLVIFDVGLPDGSGFLGAKELQRVANTPFVFVTAQSDAQTRLDAFEMGASEFIPKPFHLKELLLRVEHVLENHRPSKTLNLPGLSVNFGALAIEFPDGRVNKLSGRDFDILKLLIERSPAVVSRDDILNIVWGEAEFPTHRTVDNAIVRIRQALAEKSQDFLCSVRGVGYQWLS